MPFVLLIALLCACVLSPASAADITGKATLIVDGDTFDIESPTGRVRIRICGIDSPERGHNGYTDATEELRALIAGRDVRCVRVGEGSVCDGRSKPTNNRRVVAQCFSEGSDIAGEMIAAGAACDWPKFSGGHYQRIGINGVCVRR